MEQKIPDHIMRQIYDLAQQAYEDGIDIDKSSSAFEEGAKAMYLNIKRDEDIESFSKDWIKSQSHYLKNVSILEIKEI